MFPGYISVYRDELENVHLYFFKGLSDDGTQIYRNLDLDSIKISYDKVIYDDGAMDIIFDKDVDSVSCTLIELKTNKLINITINNF